MVMGFSSSHSATSSQDKSTVDRQRIIDLEQQLQELSNTAAAALDRVWELEKQIEDMQPPRGIHRSNSSSSASSFDSYVASDEERLRKLCSAVDTIHKARTELREPVLFQYV